MLAIIDYGFGNLRSVQKGFEKVGITARITQNPTDLAGATGIVLPGVGGFRDAIAALHQYGFSEAIQEVVSQGIPLLGICLGMQLLLTESYEMGTWKGLDLIPGKVRLFPEMGLKVPQMGWNSIRLGQPTKLLEGVPDQSNFYFVHSYYVDPTDPGDIMASTDYGLPFAAVIGRGKIYGVQFHPEKSSQKGLTILQNFGRICQ